jgi:glutamyl-tRNA reductase
LSVVVVGLEHHQVPLDLLERVVVGDAELPKVLSALRERVNLEESVLLSTCLRTEVYAVVDRFHDAVFEVQDLLSARAGLDSADLAQHLSIRFDDDVPTHLFAVAAGLESAVLGETEVLGQVRRAWEQADQERVGGPVLAALFRHAVQTGRRVRSETAIARGTTSFSHAAVELAEQRLDGGLGGRPVAVVGAGEMGSGLVEALAGRPEGRRPSELALVNRSPERASALTRRASSSVPCRVVALERAEDALHGAEVVFTALRADAPTLGPTEFGSDGHDGTADDGRPRLVVDLGVPRNVEPAVGRIPGITLLDMDDLRSSVRRAMAERRAEVDRARAIVTEEVTRYREASRARGAAPVIAALRHRLEEARVTELERRRNQFGDLSEHEWQRIDAVTRSVLAKVLHEPSVLLKETAGSPRGERLVEALRLLFDL